MLCHDINLKQYQAQLRVRPQHLFCVPIFHSTTAAVEELNRETSVSSIYSVFPYSTPQQQWRSSAERFQ